VILGYQTSFTYRRSATNASRHSFYDLTIEVFIKKERILLFSLF